MPAVDLQEALERFAEGMRSAYSVAGAAGDPEDQLKPLIKDLLEAHPGVSAQTEIRIDEGRPDVGVYLNGALVGFIELKEPGKSIAPSSFRGHDRRQWNRFRNLPNLIYTNGRDWILYRKGKAERRASLAADPLEAGSEAVDERVTQEIEALFADFLSWSPIVPSRPRELADLLADLTRIVRQRVADAVIVSDSGIRELWETWQNTLFPEANEKRFADAYAQTLTFALLLARIEGAAELHDPRRAADALRDHHGLLGSVLEVLAYPGSRAYEEVRVEYELLARVLEALDPAALRNGGTHGRDPWLYFYEDFLAAYDPKMRKDYGVYYTPVEVVGAMVRLTHDALRRMGKPAGLADEGVLVLDPAAGTGTFPLATFDLALEEARSRFGEGIVPAKAAELAQRLFAFEILIGPYAVAHLRLQRAYLEEGAEGKPQVYLTDTLEAPELRPLAHLGVLEKPLVKEHEEAMAVKRDAPVLVVIGNPPYDRHSADDPKGGWVRFGFGATSEQARRQAREKLFGPYAERRLLDDFIDPVREAGASVHLKNVYNLYVYFWRWALWKVFESPGAPGPGIVTFITASSYLRGPGFAGMRKFMREVFDDLWILDLGGDNRAPSWARDDENVFNIETPVAIAVGVRYAREKARARARVRYVRLRGPREAKLKRLAALSNLDDLPWKDAPEAPDAPFVPGASGDYLSFLPLRDLFPWQYSGVEFKRTWPIAPDPEVLRARWRRLLEASLDERQRLFKETDDRTVFSEVDDPVTGKSLDPIGELSPSFPPTEPVRYGFRSLDRQWALLDPRLASRLRPPLVASHGPGQLYLTTLMSIPLGAGPAIMATALIPDRHYFSGRGGKDVLPLFRDPAGERPNLAPALLSSLKDELGFDVLPGDFAAYVYGLLSNPAYTAAFHEELEAEPGPRVPVTKDPRLFERAVALGRELLWLHTYGERYADGRTWPPPLRAKVVQAIPHTEEGYPEDFSYDPETQTLRVGEGAVAPVSRAAWDYEISGWKPLRRWLKYRMKKPAGKSSSALDAIVPSRWPARFTEELLELIEVLERTVEINREQAPLLEEVLASPLFTPDELGLDEIPEELRQPPKFKVDDEQKPLFD
ncbi:protein of unknown function DUF450 (plasmid) [Oceanithermus profundus DSM 14977]|uniref:site-specific DNA-methyltransferase (adenine-specific) n=1 Tax=Oceanithermus profundus (strain DSM 14977 / NBRC 100410 / VKM B-2274 / 506) TaxID=670487 RepID=E4UAV1_OCEP5|nr:type ISP restriction/modification enzyme [Oceanithermus profundus]ADR37736.1 protein of unknown function DUF450 [Oceanithermus profundus DSM 14977]